MAVKQTGNKGSLVSRERSFVSYVLGDSLAMGKLPTLLLRQPWVLPLNRRASL